MKYLLPASLALFISFQTNASGLSAFREESQTYEMLRSKKILFESTVPSGAVRQTAEDVRKPLASLSTSNIPKITDANLFFDSFKALRDLRFIPDKATGLSRRLTWLYPDDGCFARAELAAEIAVDKKLPAPAKIFAFGNLRARTPNTSKGFVTWWYHVSIAYKHGGEVYVWDPSIEPLHPLKLKEWGKLLGSESTKVEFSICSANTFDPTFDCTAPEGVGRARALREQNVFLRPEWIRLKSLGRDPTRELANEPPWLKPAGETSMSPDLPEEIDFP